MKPYDKRFKDPQREPVLGINKYKFCEGCEYIRTTAHGKTCPARFNPFEPMTEVDGSPRTDGRDGCPKNEKFMRLQKQRNTQEFERRT